MPRSCGCTRPRGRPQARPRRRDGGPYPRGRSQAAVRSTQGAGPMNTGNTIYPRRGATLPLAGLLVTAAAVLALMLVGGHGADAHSGAAHAAKRAGVSKQQRALHDGMRKLWEDHITWTRLFIVSASADLPDRQATTERLLRNQADIGKAIKPFYGRAGGERLSALLTEHILVAADVLAAAKA